MSPILLQGGLRQVKFLEGGEVREQGVAIAKVANGTEVVPRVVRVAG
jgi:hypothetical protein